MSVPSGSLEPLASKWHVNDWHDDDRTAVGGRLPVDGGSTMVQPMPLAPATVVVAVAPGHWPAGALESAIAAVIRPEPDPTEEARSVTDGGVVQPELLADLSDQ